MPTKGPVKTSETTPTKMPVKCFKMFEKHREKAIKNVANASKMFSKMPAKM
jgi:hypothetical protein